LFTK